MLATLHHNPLEGNRSLRPVGVELALLDKPPLQNTPPEAFFVTMGARMVGRAAAAAPHLPMASAAVASSVQLGRLHYQMIRVEATTIVAEMGDLLVPLLASSKEAHALVLRNNRELVEERLAPNRVCLVRDPSIAKIELCVPIWVCRRIV
jgi:hypothetical protein